MEYVRKNDTGTIHWFDFEDLSEEETNEVLNDLDYEILVSNVVINENVSRANIVQAKIIELNYVEKLLRAKYGENNMTGIYNEFKKLIWNVESFDFG